MLQFSSILWFFFFWVFFVRDVVLPFYIFLWYICMDTYHFFVIHIGVWWAFPNHLTGVWGKSGTGHEETVVFQVSLLKTSVFCCSDVLFLQNVATSPLPLNNICVYRRCELQAMSSTRSLLTSANAALAF